MPRKEKKLISMRLPDDIKEMLDEMAKNDFRDRTQMVSWLVKREYDKRNAKGKIDSLIIEAED